MSGFEELLALGADGAADGLDALDAEGLDDGAGHGFSVVAQGVNRGGLSEHNQGQRINNLDIYATGYQCNSS